MSREYEGKVPILGIGGRDSPAAMAAFVKEFGLPFPSAVDRNFDLYSRFGARIQDTWVFLDAQGNEVDRSIYAELSESQLKAQLDRLVSS